MSKNGKVSSNETPKLHEVSLTVHLEAGEFPGLVRRHDDVETYDK